METVYLYMMELWILLDIFKVSESLALEVEKYSFNSMRSGRNTNTNLELVGQIEKSVLWCLI